MLEAMKIEARDSVGLEIGCWWQINGPTYNAMFKQYVIQAAYKLH